MTAVSAPAQRRSRSLWSVVRHLGAFGVVGGVCFVIEVVLFQETPGRLTKMRAGSRKAAERGRKLFLTFRFWMLVEGGLGNVRTTLGRVVLQHKFVVFV